MARRKRYTITDRGVSGPGGPDAFAALIKKYVAGPPKPKPPTPPAGMYDPALEAQRRAGARGLGDFRQDTELGGARAAQDYTFGIENLQQGRDRGYEDITRQTEALTRSYGQLQRRQAEGARQAGVLSGGLALKAAQIRAANQALDQAPLDTARARIGQDYSRDSGALSVGYARGGVDRATGLSRAGREQQQFGLDIGEQERFQAVNAGWLPPSTPARNKLWADGTWHTTPAPMDRRRRRAHG